MKEKFTLIFIVVLILFTIVLCITAILGDENDRKRQLRKKVQQEKKTRDEECSIEEKRDNRTIEERLSDIERQLLEIQLILRQVESNYSKNIKEPPKTKEKATKHSGFIDENYRPYDPNFKPYPDFDVNEILPDKPINVNSPLYGKRVYFTGILPVSRIEAVRIAKNCGADVKNDSKCPKKTAYLIKGDPYPDWNDLTLKERTVRSWIDKGADTKIINWEEFIALVEKNDTNL